MAVVNGTIADVHSFNTFAGPKTNSAFKEFGWCIIDVTFAGTYDTTADGTIAAVPTAIQNARRDGRTITILSAGLVAPGDEAGTLIAAKTVQVSGSSITCELTTADGATEHANGALGAFNEGIKLGVAYLATPI